MHVRTRCQRAPWPLGSVAVLGAVMIGLLSACTATPQVPATTTVPPATTTGSPVAPAAPGARGSSLALNLPPARICSDKPVSPYRYHYGGSGDVAVAYRSGTPGLPTYGSPGADYPRATRGFIVPVGGPPGSRTSNDSAIWDKGATVPSAVYWFAPGTHHGSHGIYAQDQDVFLGGPGAVIDGAQKGGGIVGYGTGVTVGYLSFENIGIHVDGAGWAAINPNLAAGWTMTDLVVQGTGDAAINVGPRNIVKDNCLTHNGQAGIIGYNGYSSVIENNEVSFNDPVKGGQIDYAGSPIQCGCAGGIKLLGETDDTVSGNYVHDNGDAGIWLDTNNAGITITGNYIAHNPSTGIIYEASYDGLIKNNVLVANGIASNKDVRKFGNPVGAIYIADSGSVPRSTGLRVTPYCVTIKKCPVSTAVSCAGLPACQQQFQITGNTFIDNWDGVIVYSNDTRNAAYCPSGAPRPGSCPEAEPSGHVGTLIGGTIWGQNGKDPQGIVPCYNAEGAGPGRQPDYWLACIWPVMGVQVTANIFRLSPEKVNAMRAPGSPACTVANLCGISGLYAFDGGCCETGNFNPGNGFQPPGCPSGGNPPFVCDQSQDADISYNWGNEFRNNSYDGPWNFWAWDQADQNLPYSWARWTGPLQRCSTSDSDCSGGFGQDQGSTYRD
jgi:parallel beta-helix repeat protein